jgi:hypothetical protein
VQQKVKLRATVLEARLSTNLLFGLPFLLSVSDLEVLFGIDLRATEIAGKPDDSSRVTPNQAKARYRAEQLCQSRSRQMTHAIKFAHRIDLQVTLVRL